MKKSDFIIFLSIVLVIYFAVNFYIYRRGKQAISQHSILCKVYFYLFLFLSLSYGLGRVLERIFPSLFSESFVWIGSFWLGAMLYFFLIILLVDLLRLIHHFVPFYPSFITKNLDRAKLVAAGFSVGIVLLTLGYGYINAVTLRIKELRIAFYNKKTPLKQLKIALISDIHLGTIIGKSRLEKLIEKVNRLEPDIILLAGDIIDDDVRPFYQHKLQDTLRKFKAKLGVYGVTGNHEYIAGINKTVEAIENSGIKLLKNSVVKIQNSFYLIGRNDWISSRAESRQRKPLSEILTGIDNRLPLILMDHSPFNLEDAANNGVDLQVSGHTHSGQLWPFNYLTNIIFELSWGYKKKMNTHYYVSSGAGTWGPPIRTGSHSEIVNIILEFR